MFRVVVGVVASNASAELLGQRDDDALHSLLPAPFGVEPMCAVLSEHGMKIPRKPTTAGWPARSARPSPPLTLINLLSLEHVGCEATASVDARNPSSPSLAEADDVRQAGKQAAQTDIRDGAAPRGELAHAPVGRVLASLVWMRRPARSAGGCYTDNVPQSVRRRGVRRRPGPQPPRPRTSRLPRVGGAAPMDLSAARVWSPPAWASACPTAVPLATSAPPRCCLL
jgi:hypothetical protein